MDTKVLVAAIEHTALKPEVTAKEIDKLCEEANRYGFFGVCVAGYWIKRAVDNLRGSDIKVVTVVGFPHGNSITRAKSDEANLAIALGASEIDMVLNIGALKSGGMNVVAGEISEVSRHVHKGNAKLKVIIETALLSNDEMITACKITQESGADFVKTSTGFASSGAKVEDVRLMRSVVGNRFGIKAAGGIRDYSTAIAMLEAGANRIGCSASRSIVDEALRNG